MLKSRWFYCSSNFFNQAYANDLKSTEYKVSSPKSEFEFSLILPECVEPAWMVCFLDVKLLINKRDEKTKKALQVLEIEMGVPKSEAIKEMLFVETRSLDNIDSLGHKIFKIGDFNFDGYTDFALMTGAAGGYGTPSYTFYIFDPKKGFFYEDFKFSALTNQGQIHHYFDYLNKKISVYSRSSSTDSREDIYVVKNNIPNLLSSTTRVLTNQDGVDKIKVVLMRQDDTGAWTRKSYFEEIE
ncbi:MAG: hypothetical protein VXW65_13725 [Pseudomonadota bacterium]|nr:hypothetical protein [Pseudomonadota bacterium]